MGLAASAHAAAQVSKLSLVFSGNPTTIKAQKFNENVIDAFNAAVLDPRGLESIDKITFGWLYEAELRYFVRPNFTVSAGVGQLKSVTKQDFLPAIGMGIGYRAEVLTVPVHVGGAYYLPPYNQGDFQARWYLGGGLTSNVYNRAKFTGVESNTDSLHTLVGNFKLATRRDSPGYFVETGVHMFFAGRWSVMLGGMYRSAMIHQTIGTLERTPRGLPTTTTPVSVDLDMSGIGGKMAIAIGL